jgi:hypothetical protein
MTIKKRSLPTSFEELLSPPPVLRSEDRELYERIRDQFMACFAPEDVLEWHLVNRLVEEAWFIKRYNRHQTLAIERRHHQSLEFQVQRLKVQNARKEALAKRTAGQMTQKPAEVADLLHLEENVLDTASEIDEIFERTPTELQYNRALEKSMLFQEQLDKLIASATKRFNEALELLEHYREGLGARLRQVAEEVLKDDFPEKADNGSAPPGQPSASIVLSEEEDEVTKEINEYLAQRQSNDFNPQTSSKQTQ